MAILCAMKTEPLAILLYDSEKLMPCSQLGNRLQDLGYRVCTLHEAAALTAQAEQQKALVVLVDLVSRQDNVYEAIAQLKQHATTAHIPVIAFSTEADAALHDAARAAGAALVVTDAAVTHHLSQLLDQALTQF
jgi:PleD family two-component response regulator